MAYSQAQIGKILQKIIAKASHELQVAALHDNVDEVMEKYGITFEEEAMPVNPRTSKILILGALAGKVSDYQLAAKKIGVSPDNLEFVSDYHELKHFSAGVLRNSLKYSDIIYGPSPHKMKEMGDTSSLLAEMQKEPQCYPRLTKAVANKKLKITITNFKNALSNTRYLESQF